MSKNNYDGSFNDCINELQKMYTKNPERADRKAHQLLQEIKSDSGSVWNDIVEKKDTILLVFACFVLLFTGLLSLKTFSMYLFGFLFLMAGLFVGLKVKGFGIIFLFSHGMTGLAIMIMSLLAPDMEELSLSSLYKDPVLADYGNNLQIFLAILGILIFCGVIYVILYNLSDTLKKKKYSIFPPLIIFEIVLLMCAFIYIIVPIL